MTTSAVGTVIIAIVVAAGLPRQQMPRRDAPAEVMSPDDRPSRGE